MLNVGYRVYSKFEVIHFNVLYSELTFFLQYRTQMPAGIFDWLAQYGYN